MMKHRTCAPFVKVSSAFVITPNNILTRFQKTPKHDLRSLSASHLERPKLNSRFRSAQTRTRRFKPCHNSYATRPYSKTWESPSEISLSTSAGGRDKANTVYLQDQAYCGAGFELHCAFEKVPAGVQKLSSLTKILKFCGLVICKLACCDTSSPGLQDEAKRRIFGFASSDTFRDFQIAINLWLFRRIGELAENLI